MAPEAGAFDSSSSQYGPATADTMQGSSAHVIVDIDETQESH